MTTALADNAGSPGAGGMRSAEARTPSRNAALKPKSSKGVTARETLQERFTSTPPNLTSPAMAASKRLSSTGQAGGPDTLRRPDRRGPADAQVVGCCGWPWACVSAVRRGAEPAGQAPGLRDRMIAFIRYVSAADVQRAAGAAPPRPRLADLDGVARSVRPGRCLACGGAVAAEYRAMDT